MLKKVSILALLAAVVGGCDYTPPKRSLYMGMGAGNCPTDQKWTFDNHHTPIQGDFKEKGEYCPIPGFSKQPGK